MAMLIGTSTASGPLGYSDALAKALNRGWVMVSEGPSGAQLRKPKKMSSLDKVCLGLGIPLLFLFGVGLILILVAVLDYAFFTKEKTAFISRDNPVLPA